MLDSRLRETMSFVLGVDESELDDGASVETVESWDSIHHMNLILALEDEFDVRFPEDSIAELTSFSALRDQLSKLTSG